jgi:glyoxylase I family protein
VTTALRWSHVALNCADQAVTEEFYRRWFGFERARAVTLPDDSEIVFIRQGDVHLELFGCSTAAPFAVSADGPAYHGVARHLAFQTDDLDAFLERVGAEIPISLGPLTFDAFIKGWHSVWLTDPDGVIVEVSEGYRDDEA